MTNSQRSSARLMDSLLISLPRILRANRYQYGSGPLAQAPARGSEGGPTRGAASHSDRPRPCRGRTQNACRETPRHAEKTKETGRGEGSIVLAGGFSLQCSGPEKPYRDPQTDAGSYLPSSILPLHRDVSLRFDLAYYREPSGAGWAAASPPALPARPRGPESGLILSPGRSPRPRRRYCWGASPCRRRFGPLYPGRRRPPPSGRRSR